MTCQQVSGGYECEKEKSITFSSYLDTSNPLTSHVWTIDGTQESTGTQFQKTYQNTGTHNVIHAGANACGATCSSSATLSIVDTVQPQQPPSSLSSNAPIIAVAAVVVVLGILGIAMMKKKVKG